MKNKQIQIPQELFIALIQYFALDEPTKEQHEYIRQQLDNKLNRMIEHDLYSTYKNASSPEQKEKARREYLESKGIPQNFRW